MRQPPWSILTAPPGKYIPARDHSDSMAFRQRQEQRRLAAQLPSNVRKMERKK